MHLPARLVAAVVLIATHASLVAQSESSAPESRPTTRAESQPTTQPGGRPRDVVLAYVEAGKSRDYDRLGNLFVAPIDRLCRTLADYVKAQEDLKKAAKEKFGDAGVRAAEDRRIGIFLTTFQKIEIIDEKVDGEAAVVSASLTVAENVPPIPTSFEMVRQSGDWKIAMIGGRPLLKTEQADSWILEWGVAVESLKRTFGQVKDGIAKTASDVEFLRRENLKTITQERSILRKSGLMPESVPAGHAPLLTEAEATRGMVRNPHTGRLIPTSQATSQPTSMPKKK